MKSVRNLFKLFVSLLIAVTVFFPCASHALTASQLQQQQSAISQEKKQLQTIKTQKQIEASGLSSELKNISSTIGQVEQSIEETQAAIATSQAQIQELKIKIQNEEANLAKEKEKQGQLISSWYMEGESGLMEAVIGSNSLSEVVERTRYYDAVRAQINESIERINRLKDELNKVKSEQETKVAELAGKQDQQKRQEAALEDQKRTKDQLYTNTVATISQLDSKIKAAEARERQVLNEISSLLSAKGKNWGAERGKGQKVSAGDLVGTMGSTGYSTGAHLHFEVRNPGGAVVDPRGYLGSRFIWPTLSRRVTQEFGWTDYARAGAYNGGIHTGLDIGAQTPGVWGDPIFAAGSGEIVLKQYYGGYGYCVVILHDDNTVSLYGHLGSAN